MSGLELNRQLGAHSKIVQPPSAITFRACYQNPRPVLESAGPADAAGAFIVFIASTWLGAPRSATAALKVIYLSLGMIGSAFRQLQLGWIRNQLRIKRHLQRLAYPA
jgi:hypothetical protein